MNEFDLSFRFHFCINWIETKKVNLKIEKGLISTKLIFGIDGDEKEFSDLGVFCLFVEGLMKAEEWQLEDKEPPTE